MDDLFPPLDEALLKKTAPDIHQRILNNEIIEVSTGLFVDQKPRPGTFNGKSYDAVATNHRPDHLAILPDEEGACSVRDGAGLLQIHSKGKTQMKINKKVVVDEIIANGCFSEEDRPWLLTANETQLGSLLAPLINEDEEEDFEIEDEDLSDVDDSDEYEDDDSDEYEDDELETNSKGKKKKIAGAQDNSTGAAPMFKKGKGGKTPKGGIPTMCQSMESYIAGLPAEAQEIFRIGQQTLNNKKRALIGAITSNSGNLFPKQQLAGMEIEELEALASLSTNGGQQDGTGRRYAPIYDGAAGGAFAINSAGGNPPALTMPTINFKDGDE